MNIIDYYQMGIGRHWLASLIQSDHWCLIQFWSSIFVLYASIFQLHISRKLRWPPEPGRITVFFYWVGITFKSPFLAFRLGDLGSLMDVLFLFVGRAGIALQSFTAVIALDDSLSGPNESRPMICIGLISIVMVQMRALTAYYPREENNQ